MKSFKFKNILPILLLVMLKSAVGAKYNCTLSEDNKICTITGLNLTRDDYLIELDEANLTDDVSKLVLEGAVPVLSPDGICKAMPNLKEFQMNLVSMEEIDERAFENCTKLTKIFIVADNKFINLKKNTFKGLSELQELVIRRGNIPEVDINFDDLKQLKQLALNDLNIVKLPVRILREQANLERLSLISNNLTDLDVEGILNYTTKLKEINLEGNFFSCSHLTGIFTLLKGKTINITTDWSDRQCKVLDTIYQSFFKNSVKIGQHSANITSLEVRVASIIDQMKNVSKPEGNINKRMDTLEKDSKQSQQHEEEHRNDVTGVRSQLVVLWIFLTIIVLMLVYIIVRSPKRDGRPNELQMLYSRITRQESQTSGA